LPAEALPRVLDGGAVFRSAAHISAKSGEDIVFTVKGIDPSGRAMTYACGTDEQAMERTWELKRRGFRDVVVIDPKGRELGAVAFEQSLEIDWSE
jgi:hypothetical protein